MTDINCVTLVGRLTREAELRYTGGGLPINKFSIAVNRQRKVENNWEEEVSFIDCTMFGKRAEALKNYMQKGKQVVILGELRQSRWQQDGQNRSKLEVIVNDIQLVGGRSDGDAPQTSQAAAGNYQSGQSPEEFEDDIPF